MTKGASIAPIEFYIGLFSASSVQHLCGPLLIEVEMDLTVVTETSMPVAYDTATGILTVYSADLSLIETRKHINFSAKFSRYHD